MAATEKYLYQGTNTGVMYTDRRDFYIQPNVFKELWTDVAPFTTILMNQSFVTGLKDPMYKMFQHKNPWAKQMFRIQTGATNAADDGEDAIAPYAFATTTCIGFGTALPSAIVGMEFGVFADDGSTNGAPTGQRKGTVIVTTFTSVTNIGVKNTSGSSVTIANGDWLVYQGNAFGEGTTAATPWADELSVVWGQAQIFKTSYQVTGTLKAAALRGETKEFERLRKQKGEQHKISQEKAFLFGGAPAYYTDSFADGALTDANGNDVRKTMGILEALLRYGNTSGSDQNVFTIPQANYSYATFVGQMESVFQYYPEDGVKDMLCSAKMLSYWSIMEGTGVTTGIAKKSGWTVNIGDVQRDKLGFNYRMLDTPHGMLRLINCPSLTRSPYNGYGIIIDKNNLQYNQYRPDQFQQNIKTEDAFDGQKDQYFSDAGLGITLIESHKLFYLT
jgi:hypothetical protein